MFKRILRMLLSEGLLSKNQVADAIGIQVETLDDMLQIMMERGLLRAGECVEPVETHCTACPVASDCHSASTSNDYYVTDKGKRYAGR